MGRVGEGSSGNDVITDFDTNNFDIDAQGSESNFDTLAFTFGDRDFELSQGSDFVEFVRFIESDGDRDTDGILDGEDLVFDFGNGDSVRIESILGDDGITREALDAASVDIFE